MAEPGAPERPRQVTFAGILAVVGCLLLVFSLFDAMELVRSADVRDEVAAFLDEPPGDGLGLTVDGALGLLRGVVLLTGALAAAGVVLGVYALQRHRGARVGLTIVAGLLLLVSMSQLVGVLPALVAAAATLLWTREARAWFDGRVLEPDPGRGDDRSGSGDASGPARPDPFARPALTARPGHQAPAPPTSSTSSPPQAGWAPPALGDRVDGPARETAPTSAPGPATRASLAAPAGPVARPRTVTVALLLTVVLSGLTALVLLGSMVRALSDKDGVFQQLRTTDPDGILGSTPNEVLRLVLVVQVVGILWCLVAIGLALAARQRTDWARVTLVVCALVAALFSLAALVAAFPIPLPHVVATIAVAVLLLTPSSNAWFARRQGAGGGSSGPGSSSGPGLPSGPAAWPPPHPSQHGQHGQHGQQGPQAPHPSPGRTKPPVW